MKNTHQYLYLYYLHLISHESEFLGARFSFICYSLNMSTLLTVPGTLHISFKMERRIDDDGLIDKQKKDTRKYCQEWGEYLGEQQRLSK